MSITIEIDDASLVKAKAAAKINDASALVRQLLLKEIERQAMEPKRDNQRAREDAQYFAALGGSMPDLEIPRRRRVEDYSE